MRKRKNPQTLRGWARKYKRMHAAYLKTFDDLKAQSFAYREQLIEARVAIAKLKAERDRAVAADWAAFDGAVDATTAAEVALFQASPAYIKYQQARAVREEARPFTEAEKARRLLQGGNWRAP